MTSTPPRIQRTDLRVGDLLSSTNRLLGTRFWPLVGLTALAVILSGVPVVLQGPMMIGLMLCFAAVQRGEPIGVETLFKGFDWFMEGLIASLILLAVNMASVIFVLPPSLLFMLGAGEENGILMVLGFLAMVAFIVPFALFLMVLTDFTFALMARHELKGVDAVKLAFQGISQNLLSCAKVGGAAIGILFLGQMLCGVGIFLALPVVHVLLWFAAHEIFKSDSPAEAGEAVEPEILPAE